RRCPPACRWLMRLFVSRKAAPPGHCTLSLHDALPILEDDRPVGELLAGAIGDEPGFYAIHVTDPAAAIETAKNIRPDVLVVDVGLPGMSGLELYDRLRRDERTRDIPVLFETGMSGEESDREFRKRGIAAYVKKPFELSEVVAFVKMLARPRRAGAHVRS